MYFDFGSPISGSNPIEQHYDTLFLNRLPVCKIKKQFRTIKNPQFKKRTPHNPNMMVLNPSVSTTMVSNNNSCPKNVYPVPETGPLRNFTRVNST